MRKVVVSLKVSECSVVQSRNVNQCCKSVVKHT